jgi:hypothetical protein
MRKSTFFLILKIDSTAIVIVKGTLQKVKRRLDVQLPRPAFCDQNDDV